VRPEPEVTDYQVYAGVASPFNFNGLVRHYFMRHGAAVADIQVNLVNKHDRTAQSHDIAKRVRPRVANIAATYGARVAVAEVPPGPPVLETLVAEIYGPTEDARFKLARQVRDIFQHTPGVVDVDWYLEADQPKTRFVIDKEKAALHGISAETISQTLKIAVSGQSIDLVHKPREKEDVNLVLELPRSARTTPEELLALRVRSGDANALPEPGASSAPLVPLRELVTLEVFRDLGMAFGAVCILIYVLMVGWFRSFLTPIIVMAAIPFSLVGILPAHGLLPAFFTATSMIGFMAGAGIVVRNSIILVDFIELRLAEGLPLAEAVVDAGAVRFRPMLLTAMAVVVGAAVILFDPIFQGLAISLMAGEVASLLISRMAVPVLYFMACQRPSITMGTPAPLPENPTAPKVAPAG